ncbi:MAG: SPOR domain-containing protein [Mariprofundaceae bacterium]|nr:SPOR domain-containing protein [Mariprofundaceae bacterium]
MMKILKPLIFTVCLVVVFAIGYSISPGKGEAVDNTEELTRLQEQLNKKDQSLASLQASLDALKSEQVALKKSMDEAEAKHQTQVATAAQDKDAANTDVGALNFYNDLPKQKVQPEPLQADPKKLAALASPTVTAIAAMPNKNKARDKEHKSTPKAAAGMSNKPLAANQVLTPSVKKERHKSTAKSKTLPARYIPPGFKSGKIPAPKRSKAKEVKTSKPAKKTSQSTATFMVQMGSFKSNEATTKMRGQLRKQGYSVHVRKADVKGKPVFRVMIGPYHSSASAKKAQASLKKKMGVAGLVIKNK